MGDARGAFQKMGWGSRVTHLAVWLRPLKTPPLLDGLRALCGVVLV
jgi:hypothetical protein